MKLEAELISCPFCGAVRVFGATDNGYGRYYVWCDECNAQGPARLTEEKAIAAWNARCEPPVEDLDAIAARLIDTHEYHETERIVAMLVRDPSLEEVCISARYASRVNRIAVSVAGRIATDGFPRVTIAPSPIVEFVDGRRVKLVVEPARQHSTSLLT